MFLFCLQHSKTIDRILTAKIYSQSVDSPNTAARWPGQNLSVAGGKRYWEVRLKGSTEIVRLYNLHDVYFRVFCEMRFKLYTHKNVEWLLYATQLKYIF